MNKTRILIVEDEAIVARDIHQQMVNLGYEPVASTADAEAAILLAEQLHPDLVLMDVRLAGEMDGIAAAETIRERFVIPVVFLTALVDDEIFEHAKLAGPFGYVIKPFHERELHRVIEMALYRSRTEALLRRSSEEGSAILRTALDGFVLADLEGQVLAVNDRMCEMTGFAREELTQMSIADLEPEEPPARIAANFQRIKEAGSARFERRLRHRDGRRIEVEISVNYLPHSGGRVFGFLRDITERKRLERERDGMVRLLKCINDHDDLHRLMRAVTALLRDWAGCEAVGLRLQDGDDFPYFETLGFPAQFVQAENSLCERDSSGQVARDGSGHPVLECMCGNVLCGRFNPAKPYFTAHGSFWTNSTTRLLASTTEADRQARARNRCHEEGCESVALVPLRKGATTIGLLQLKDQRPDRFTLDRIHFLEQMAGSLAIAITHLRALEGIRQSEERYRTIADFTYDWEYWMAPDGSLPYVSPSCERVTGYTAEEFQKDPELLRRIVHPADRERLEGHPHFVGDATMEIDLHEADFRIFTRTGEERWIGHVCRRVYDRAGQYLGRRASNREITDRKRSERHLLKFFMLIPELTCIVSTEGHFLKINPAWPATLGYSEEQILTTPFFDFVHADDQRETRQEFARAIAGDGIAGFTNRFRCQDGRYKWLEWKTTQVVDQNLLFASARDVTDRKRMELELRASLRQVGDLQTALNEHAIVAVTDAGGRIAYANQKFCVISKYPIEELLGQDHRIINSGYHSKEFMRDLWATITQGRVWQGDIKNRAKDGTEYWVATTIVPFLNKDGMPRQYVAIRTDITRRKRAEQALHEAHERLQRLSRKLIDAQETERRSLARNLHDGLGQTLTAAKIRLQSLIRFPDPQKNEQRLEESVDVIDQVLQQVRQLSLILRPPLLDDLGLGAALRWVASQQAAGGLHFEITVPDDLPRFNSETEITVFRIAQEALTNVVRHGKARHVLLTVRLHGDSLELMIRDDGVGFDVAAARRRAAHGGSIGVLGMEERAQLVGGRLEITSQPGQGTELHAWLPLTRPTQI